MINYKLIHFLFIIFLIFHNLHLSITAMEGRLTEEELERLIQEFLAAAGNEQDQTEEDGRRMVADGNERIIEVSYIVFQIKGNRGKRERGSFE
jgi:hypothetical protein